MGEWPLCPHGYGSGTLAAPGDPFHETWDENIAPPPGEDFKPAPGVTLPTYEPDKGYRITSLGDRQKLMRLNKCYDVGMPVDRRGR